MLSRVMYSLAGIVALGALAAGQGQSARHRLNPMIDLLEQKQPVFGLYRPSPNGSRGRGAAAAATPAEPPKTPIRMAMEVLANGHSDFMFDGSMEGGFDRGRRPFSEFVKAMTQAGVLPRRRAAAAASAGCQGAEIAPDAAKAADNIAEQLNIGVERGHVRRGRERGGSAARPRRDALQVEGRHAPRQRRQGAGVLGHEREGVQGEGRPVAAQPDGELVNWTIVESKEGLAHVREIAAVKGIGVLWPGAGTLRGVFTTTNADGEREVR